MKKRLEEAVKSGNVENVRGILLEMVASKGGSISTIEDMAEAIGSTPDLFEKDDGKLYALSAKELTPAQIEALREDVKHNFSIPKFRMLAEVQEIVRTHPDYFKNRSRDVEEKFEFPDGSVKIKEHIIDDDVVTLEAEEQPDDEAEKIAAENSEDISGQQMYAAEEEPTHSQAGKKAGYLLLIVGLVCSIVGICVPVRFMIGLGIGVMMLGAGVVYASLRR